MLKFTIGQAAKCIDVCHSYTYRYFTVIGKNRNTVKLQSDWDGFIFELELHTDADFQEYTYLKQKPVMNHVFDKLEERSFRIEPCGEL